MTSIYQLFPNVTTITSNTKGSNQGKKTKNEYQISFGSNVFPFFHHNPYDVAKENKHRHVQHPTGKLEIAHFNVPQSIEEKLKTPQRPGQCRPKPIADYHRS
jgi:hypothetical protein